MWQCKSVKKPLQKIAPLRPSRAKSCDLEVWMANLLHMGIASGLPKQKSALQCQLYAPLPHHTRKVGGSICNTERAQFATHRMALYWLNLQHRDGSICNTQRYTNNPLGFWVGTGGWGQWGGGVGVRGIRGVRVGDCVHTHSSYVINNPLGFWVGTGGWGQWGGLGLGELGGLVGDCVHTHSSYVINNPLGFWVGTGGWGQWGGVGVRGLMLLTTL